MKFVITVAEEIARELIEKKYRSESSKKILAITDKHFANLKPLHANTRNPELKKYFIVDTGVDRTSSSLLEELLKSGAITSAYAKPKDEPPF